MITLIVINVSDWTLPVTACFLFIILKSGLNNLMYLITATFSEKKQKDKAALLPSALFFEEGGILQQD